MLSTHTPTPSDLAAIQATINDALNTETRPAVINWSVVAWCYPPSPSVTLTVMAIVALRGSGRHQSVQPRDGTGRIALPGSPATRCRQHARARRGAPLARPLRRTACTGSRRDERRGRAVVRTPALMGAAACVAAGGAGCPGGERDGASDDKAPPATAIAQQRGSCEPLNTGYAMHCSQRLYGFPLYRPCPTIIPGLTGCLPHFRQSPATTRALYRSRARLRYSSGSLA